jgi:CRP-like cAMP-binding protein
MYQEIEKYLRKRTSVTDEEFKQIISKFQFIKTARNQMLCNETQVSKHFYFINKGCLRLYGNDSEGNEVTAFFALEESFMTAATSFITQKPSRDYLVSMEPSELLVIKRNDFFELIERIPEFNKVYLQFIEFGYIHSQMRIYSFLGMSSTDRLTWVLEHEQKLLDRISAKAVASYLGMTSSTLSKLRAKL